MRVLAMILVFVTMLAGAFFGYCYYGAQMQIEGAAVSRVPATEAMGTLTNVQDRMRDSSFLGVSFREAELAEPALYEFQTITLRMKNRGMFPMDWIQFEVQPGVADVLQLPQERTPTLAANSTADFSADILTLSGAELRHTVNISYYVLGRKITISHTITQQ